jgi:purine-binding chemotaxis protein CheW
MSANTEHETTAVAQVAITAASAGTPLMAKEWLTFRLGDEEYGLDILRVQEIRSYEKPTHIANVPDYIKGVVDLRGVIVPILDLRMRLGMTEVRYDGATVTVVLNVGGKIVGVVVDSVSDVLELKQDDVKPFPGMSTSIEVSCITGIGSLKHDGHERMLILLDITALIADIKNGSFADAELAPA